MKIPLLDFGSAVTKGREMNKIDVRSSMQTGYSGKVAAVLNEGCYGQIVIKCFFGLQGIKNSL